MIYIFIYGYKRLITLFTLIKIFIYKCKVLVTEKKNKTKQNLTVTFNLVNY